MTSNELDKLKSQHAVGSLQTRPAEKNYTLESYLRNSLEDLNASVPKVNGVTLASRLDKSSKFDPEFRSENSLVHADKWSQSFEASLPVAKRQRRLFPSLLPYLAIAIVSGGISGGALLYFLLNYAVPHGATGSSASLSAPETAYDEAPDRQPLQPAPFSKPFPKASSSPSARAENRSDLTGDANSEPTSTASDGKALEASNSAAFFSAADAHAKEPSAANKVAAIPPLVEHAPMPAPVPSTSERPEAKPPESSKADLSAAKPETPLAKLPADQEDKMLKRASTLLSENDIAGARLIFQYLAHHGSASGAFALAESYDPRKLAGRRITGMTPDANLARTWYARAADLGSKEAAAILRKDKP